MPSTLRTWQLSVLAFAVLLVAYATVVAGNFLLGIFVGTTLYLLAWLIDRLSPGNPLDDVTRARRVAAGVVVVAVLAYSVVITASVLLGVLVASTVVVVSWLTSPIGPVARWLDGVG
jgi:sterol desaturase/sphingolipid hydroxylase (fatty acid hydroxylase superfamily)